MQLTKALLISSLALLSNAQSTSLTGAQATKVANDLVAYLSSIAAQPQFTSAAAVLATAIPQSVLDAENADPSSFLQNLATGTAAPAWFTALPSDVQSYFSSVGAAESSIVNKDVKAAAAPTGAARQVGAAVVGAAGAVGWALL